MAPMRVCQVNFHPDAKDRPPHELLPAWRVLPELAEAAVREGASVDLILASRSRDEYFERNGVRIRFVSGERILNARIAEIVAQARPDILHIHGLSFPRQTLYLSLRVPHARILGTDHNDKIQGPMRNVLRRASLSRMAGVTYTARGLARVLQDARIMPRSMPIFEVIEASTWFSPGDMQEARQRTGIFGNPAILWVGHLDDRKDPMTVLDAIDLAIPNLPELELWCCYQSAPDMDRVRSRLARSVDLEKRVHLLGHKPQPEIELLHRASDFLMLGSRTEGGVVACIEAFACGSTPIVTDTICFRRLTNDGMNGGMSPMGDARAMSKNLLELSAKDRTDLRRRARAHFESELSYEAQQKQLARAYDAVLRTRS
jgi:glycosyltransferase involved in cell wall biosynthesis